MGSLNAICPPASEIGDQVDFTCGFDFGQILKFAFQRLYSSGTTLNTITPANAALLATWTALLAAVNSTKVQISPNLLGDADTAPGGKLTFGSGNAVPYGVPIITGREYTPFTSKLYNPPSKTIKALKLLEGEQGGVYLINNYGKILCKADNPTTPTQVYPIPITQFFVNDRDLGGLTDPDFHTIEWSFVPGWSDDVIAITPSDFNALTQLSGS